METKYYSQELIWTIWRQMLTKDSMRTRGISPWWESISKKCKACIFMEISGILDDMCLTFHIAGVFVGPTWGRSVGGVRKVWSGWVFGLARWSKFRKANCLTFFGVEGIAWNNFTKKNKKSNTIGRCLFFSKNTKNKIQVVIEQIGFVFCFWRQTCFHDQPTYPHPPEMRARISQGRLFLGGGR